MKRVRSTKATSRVWVCWRSDMGALPVSWSSVGPEVRQSGEQAQAHDILQ